MLILFVWASRWTHLWDLGGSLYSSLVLKALALLLQDQLWIYASFRWAKDLTLGLVDSILKFLHLCDFPCTFQLSRIPFSWFWLQSQILTYLHDYMFSTNGFAIKKWKKKYKDNGILFTSFCPWRFSFPVSWVREKDFLSGILMLATLHLHLQGCIQETKTNKQIGKDTISDSQKATFLCPLAKQWLFILDIFLFVSALLKSQPANIKGTKKETRNTLPCDSMWTVDSFHST